MWFLLVLRGFYFGGLFFCLLIANALIYRVAHWLKKENSYLALTFLEQEQQRSRVIVVSHTASLIHPMASSWKIYSRSKSFQYSHSSSQHHHLPCRDDFNNFLIAVPTLSLVSLKPFPAKYSPGAFPNANQIL